MCGEGCEICKMAKFRAGRATKNVAGIEGSEHGYVVGIEYAGPFDQDNDGNISRSWDEHLHWKHPPFYCISAFYSSRRMFWCKKMKIGRGNPKLEHGQGLVNDQTCLNK